MAHSPKKKGAVASDLVLGMTVREAAAKHNVPESTVGEWRIELETGQNRTESDRLPIRQELFQAAFYECLTEITKAITTFAKVCQDAEWVKGNPGGASDLALRTTEFADRIVARARAQAAEAADHAAAD